MNSVQTVTLNSALSQNWVGSTMRTPRTQVARAHCVHSAHVVGAAAHTASLSLACRAHVSRAARAGRAHAGRALVATRPGSLSPGRDLTSMSRPQGSQNHVATSNRCRDTTQTTPCRDIKSVSRHRFSCPHRCPYRDIKMMSRHQA